MLTNEHILQCKPFMEKFARKLAQENWEDLFQDTIIRGLSNKEKFDGNNATGWLGKIMYNHFVSGYRRKVKFESPLDPENAFRKVIINDDHDSSILVKSVLHNIDELGFKKAQIVKLAALGYQYDDISDILNIPVGTVRSSLSRAREILKTKMEKNNEGLGSKIKRNNIPALQQDHDDGSAMLPARGPCKRILKAAAHDDMHRNGTLQNSGVRHLQAEKIKKHRTKEWLLSLAPDFCWLTAKELHLMMELDHENICLFSFRQSLSKLVKEGVFSTKRQGLDKRTFYYLRNGN